ncbi:acyltransferase family protein, partial [Proteus faecis]|uniref:acyltransferase family protein n=2 Tax=Proteus TaxID=583 RepID=UPI001F3972E8
MQKKKFRTDINGMRAIAVLLVILFHFDNSLAPAGFIGVDIFFVISGYLMTSIILTGIENNNFSIVKFYSARCK